MDRFVDDDAGYLAWLEAHPKGYVLNTFPHMSSSFLVLHRTTCGTVNRPLAKGREWTHLYGKACSDDHAELAEWGLPRARQIRARLRNVRPTRGACYG